MPAIQTTQIPSNRTQPEHLLLTLHSKLALITGDAKAPLLTGITRGIEKESLRVSQSGHLAMTAHPQGLGSWRTWWVGTGTSPPKTLPLLCKAIFWWREGYHSGVWIISMSSSSARRWVNIIVVASRIPPRHVGCLA